MTKKALARVGGLCLPLLLIVAGCNSSTQAHKSAAAAPHYVRIENATAGRITGTIHFTGNAPTPVAIDMSEDPACGIASKKPNMTEQYVVNEGRMANVFVYVKDGLGNRVYMPTKTPVVVDQKGCRYIPHVIGAMVGQPVEFRNSDPTKHNVHIIAPGTTYATGFSISEPPGSEPQQHIFHASGLMIPVRCDYHPWMEAFLNLVKNPFFAVSDADGHFEIKGLPPGKYTLTAVQEKLGGKTQQVTVESGKATTVNLTFNQ